MQSAPGVVTGKLQEWSDGDPEALKEVITLVVDDLRVLAASVLNGEQGVRTLQPTALVNELYFKLHGRKQVRWESRRQFFAFASGLMRCILVDYARARRTQKRGGEMQLVTLTGTRPGEFVDPTDVLDLHDALDRLEEHDSRASQIVELRYFAGMTVPETAAALDISTATVKRQWHSAKRWLARELAEEPQVAPHR